MGVEQVIIKGLQNLENKVFKSVFGDLYTGSVKVNLKDLEGFNISEPEFDDVLRVGVYYRKGLKLMFNEVNSTNNIMYISVPRVTQGAPTLLIKNWYLYFVSKLGLDLTRETVYAHRNKDCVNSAFIGFSESLDNIDKKFLNKKGLCFDCHTLFDLDFKDAFINGLPSLLSTSCALSSQS